MEAEHEQTILDVYIARACRVGGMRGRGGDEDVLRFVRRRSEPMGRGPRAVADRGRRPRPRAGLGFAAAGVSRDGDRRFPPGLPVAVRSDRPRFAGRPRRRARRGDLDDHPPGVRQRLLELQCRRREKRHVPRRHDGPLPRRRMVRRLGARRAGAIDGRGRRPDRAGRPGGGRRRPGAAAPPRDGGGRREARLCGWRARLCEPPAQRELRARHESRRPGLLGAADDLDAHEQGASARGAAGRADGGVPRELDAGPRDRVRREGLPPRPPSPGGGRHADAAEARDERLRRLRLFEERSRFDAGAARGGLREPRRLRCRTHRRGGARVAARDAARPGV